MKIEGIKYSELKSWLKKTGILEGSILSLDGMVDENAKIQGNIFL